MADDPQTFGAFPVGVARLVSHGTATIDGKGSPASVEDAWAVVLADAKTRPTIDTVSGLPKIGAAHSTHGNLYAAEIAFSQREGHSRVWDVSVKYDRKSEDARKEGEDGNEGNITALEWGSATHAADLVADSVTGAPVLNSAGDPFEDAISSEVSDLQISFTRGEKTANLSKVLLSGSINKADITVLGHTFPKHTARVEVRIRDTLDTSARYRYEVSYTITARTTNVSESALTGSGGGVGTLRNIGFDVAVLDAGFQYLDADGEKVKFVVADAEGNLSEPQQPQLLNGSGGALPANGLPRIAVFSIYPEGDWTALHLPTDIPKGNKDQGDDQNKGGD